MTPAPNPKTSAKFSISTSASFLTRSVLSARAARGRLCRRVRVCANTRAARDGAVIWANSRRCDPLRLKTRSRGKFALDRCAHSKRRIRSTRAPTLRSSATNDVLLHCLCAILKRAHANVQVSASIAPTPRKTLPFALLECSPTQRTRLRANALQLTSLRQMLRENRAEASAGGNT